MGFVIFITSMAMLVTSILYTRLFSILYWHSSSFAVLSLALLGLAAAGLLVYFKPHFFPREKARQRIAWLMPAYGLSLVVSYLGIVSVSYADTRFVKSLWHYVPAASAALIPFFIGGLIIAVILSRFHENVSRLYFWDMLGASLGALIALGLIGFVGGTHMPIVLGIILALASVAINQRWQQKKAMVFSLCAVFFLGAFGTVPSLENHLVIKFAKGLPELPSEHEMWAPAARVKVLSNPLQFQLDSGVLSPILPFGGDVKKVNFLKRNILQLAYHLGPYKKVVIIGPGGGSDVLSALATGNTDITAVEINSGIVHYMKTALAEFSGNLYLRPEIDVVIGEGRSYLAHTKEKVDLIQATFIDTYAAAASGAHTLNENYIYTTEAIHDYLDHLSDHGIISISRWGGPQHGYGETYRTVAIAERALRERGIEEPARHIIVVQGPEEETGFRMGYQAYGAATANMATVLISKTAFTPVRLQIVRGVIAQNNFIPLWLPGGDTSPNVISKLFDAKGSAEFYHDYYASQGIDISPTSDDWPFFFSMVRPVDFLSLKNRFPWEGEEIYNFLYIPMYALHQIGFALSVLMAALILMPLAIRRQDIVSLARTKYFLLYFACLGLGFMGIELGLMQKFSLFLGHPVYSLTVVLAALLFFSGIGSLASGRVEVAHASRAAQIAGCLVVLLMACELAIPPLLTYFIALPLLIKIIITILIIAPHGFLMGMLYPLGVKSLGPEKDTLIPWMWGLSTGFSVLASILSLYMAMSYGFTATWYGFIAFYVAACLSMKRLSRN